MEEGPCCEEEGGDNFKIPIIATTAYLTSATAFEDNFGDTTRLTIIDSS